MMTNILFKDILSKIYYGTHFELIEVNKRFLRDVQKDKSLYVCDNFNDFDFSKLNNSFVTDYYVTHFRACNNYLTIYICKEGE